MQSLLNDQPLAPTTVRQCSDWYGPVRVAGARREVSVPYQPGSVYRIMLDADIFTVRTRTIDPRHPVLDLRKVTDPDRELNVSVALQAQCLAVSWSAASADARLNIEVL